MSEVRLLDLLDLPLFGFLSQQGVAFFLLLLFQGVDHAVDGLQAVGLRHHRQQQQRVLQMDGVRIGHELVEHLRAQGQRLVVGPFLIQESDGLAVTALGIVIAFHVPVEVTQCQQQHTLLNTVSHRLLVTFLIGGYRLHGVALRQIHVADGVIHLIQILLVIIVARHPSQFAELLLAALWHHLCLGDAGIKLQLVGRVVPDHVLIGLVGFLAVPQQGLDLSHQIPLPGALHATPFMTDHLPQIRHRLLIVALGDIIVRIGVIPVLHRPEIHRVAAHVSDHVLSVVQPAQLRIALGEPCSGESVLQGLGVVESGHIGEGGSGLLEGTLLELRLTQQQPRSPEEGVILPAPQPLTILGGLSAVFVPLRLHLDAMLADGLLALLDGTVVEALADLATLPFAHRVEGQHLREVVLMAFLLLQVTLDEGLRTVEIGVIARIKRVPSARADGVFLGRTADGGCCEDCDQCYVPSPVHVPPWSSASLRFFSSIRQ